MLYITLRSGTFYFNRKLPDPFRNTHVVLSTGPRFVGKNGYLRFSLQTGNRSEAIRLGRSIAVEVDRLVLPPLRASITTEAVSADDIRQAADLMKILLLQNTVTEYDYELTAGLGGAPDEMIETPLAPVDLVLPAPGGAGDAQILRQLRSLIPLCLRTATGKTISGPITTEYRPFAQAFREVMDVLQQRNSGKDVPTPPPAASNPTPSVSWDDLLSYYWTQHPSASNRTRLLYELAVKDFGRTTKPASITRQQALDWRDAMLARGLAQKTVLTRLAALKTIWRYSQQNNRLPPMADPFSGVTVVGAKNAPSSRAGYSLTELRTLFLNPPALTDIPASTGQHAALWLPLLALFTGARREELAGLLTAEIETGFEGVTYIRFQSNRLRRLKTNTSEREVPIHRTLLALGFMNYVNAVRAAGSEELWPGLRKSDRITAWWTDRVRSLIGNTGKMKDLHSFRHTFKTACRTAGIPADVHDTFTGHRIPGVGGQYGEAGSLTTLKDWIDRIDYPGFEFSPPPVPTSEDIHKQQKDALARTRSGQQRTQTRQNNLNRKIQHN